MASGAGAVYLSNGKLNVPYLEENAEVLMRAGDTALALNLYQAILASGEHRAKALRGLGICQRAEGKLQEAMKSLEESIAYEPTVKAYQELVAVLVELKQDRYCLEVIDRALRIEGITDSERAELHKTCGNRALHMNDFDTAEVQFKKALAISPNSADIRANLGVCFLKRNQFDEARRCFQDALAADNANDKAWVGLGRSIYEMGGKEAALDAFQESLRKNLLNPLGIFYLVKVGYELKRFALVEQWLDEYTSRAPVNIHLLYSHAGAKYHLGKLTDAERILKRVLELKPDHAGAKSLLEKVKVPTVQKTV